MVHSTPSFVAMALFVAAVLDSTRAAPYSFNEYEGGGVTKAELPGTGSKPANSAIHHADSTLSSKPDKAKMEAHRGDLYHSPPSFMQHAQSKQSTQPAHPGTKGITHDSMNTKVHQSLPAFLQTHSIPAASVNQPSNAGQKHMISTSVASSSSSTPTSALTPATALATATALTSNNLEQPSGLSPGTVGGIASLVMLVLAGLVAFLCIRKKRRQASQGAAQAKPDPFTQGFGSHNPPPHTAYARPMSEASMQAPEDTLGRFNVIQTYTPSLSDEINIQLGDRVEVYKEYDDGWCLGVNLEHGKKGVFPRHCVSLATSPSQAYYGGQENRAKRNSSMHRKNA